MAKGNQKKYGKKPVVSKPMKKEIKREIKNVLAPELKYHGVSTQNSSLNKVTTGTNANALCQDLCIISQGTADTNRVGDSIKLTGLECIVNIWSDDTIATTNSGHWVRIFVFQYHENSGSGPTLPDYTQLFDTVTNCITGNAEASCFRLVDREKAGLFTMLYDKLIDPKMFYGGTSGQSSKMIKFRVPLNRARKNIQYIAGQTYGYDHIYLGLLSNRAINATDFNYYSTNCRIHYTDV